MDNILETMQNKAGELGHWRNLLSSALAEFNQEQQVIKDEHEPNIKKIVRKVAKLQAELSTLIKANPDKFEKPRTHIVDQVKFGLQKQTGKLVWSDDAALVKRIDHLVNEGTLDTETAALLVRTDRKPVAAALNELDAKLLKRLGVTVEADTDAVIIKGINSDLEKEIKQLLKSADNEAEVI